MQENLRKYCIVLHILSQEILNISLANAFRLVALVRPGANFLKGLSWYVPH